MAAAVLDSQQRAITLARDATEARVGALESYAVQVQAADEAQQDFLSALRLSALNSQYLDLVARTAAGEHALAEITGLTEQAVTAAEVFRGSLHQAALAAEAWRFLPRQPPHCNNHSAPARATCTPRPKPPAAALGSPTRPEPANMREPTRPASWLRQPRKIGDPAYGATAFSSRNVVPSRPSLRAISLLINARDAEQYRSVEAVQICTFWVAGSRAKGLAGSSLPGVPARPDISRLLRVRA